MLKNVRVYQVLVKINVFILMADSPHIQNLIQ